MCGMEEVTQSHCCVTTSKGKGRPVTAAECSAFSMHCQCGFNAADIAAQILFP